MRLLLLVTLTCFSSCVFTKSIVQVDQDLCSAFGPKYWCESLKNALNCHAVSYCNEHVWAPIAKESSQDLCTTCQQYVGTIHMLISNNDTQAEIIQGMKAMCVMLPAALQSECSALIDAYGSEIVDTLVTYTADPSKFCKLIGLCNTQKLINAKPIPVGQDVCLTCQQFLGTLHMVISNQETQAEIINEMKSLCTFMSATFAPECSALVTVAGPKLVQWFVDYTADPSKFCALIGLCTSQLPLTRISISNKDVVQIASPLIIAAAKIEPAKPKTAPNTNYCMTCESLMKMVDDSLTSKPTVETVKKVLDKGCSLLGAMSSECVELVNKYSETIIQEIVSGALEPEQLCLKLHVCPAALKAKRVPTVKGNAITCELCDMAITYLDKQVGDTRTEQSIEAALTSLCSSLPKSYAEECDQLVATYTPQLIQLLLQQLQPSVICQELGLCTSASKGVLKKVPTESLLPKQSVQCDVCTLAMGYLDNALKENRTQEAIEQALDQVCSYLPKQYVEECQALVKEYEGVLIELLIQQLEPSLICKELGLCTTTKALATTECSVCQYAMGYLDSILSEKSTEDEIKKAVESLCSYLPQYISNECQQLVEQYSNTIIELLVKEMDPSTVCHKLGLCATNYQKSHDVLNSMRFSLHGVSCELCEYAMGYLDQVLDEKSTRQEIETAVKQLCSYLPPTFKNECAALVTEYGDEIIELLVNQLKPNVICKQLNLC